MRSYLKYLMLLYDKAVSPLRPNEEIGQADLWAGRFAAQQETIFFLFGKDHPWVFNTKPWQDVADFSEHLSLSHFCPLLVKFEGLRTTERYISNFVARRFFSLHIKFSQL